MAKGVDYSASIIEINKALATKYSRTVDNRAFWADDAKVLELLKMCYKTYYLQVWEYYAKLNNDKGERGIRACVKELVSNVLPLVEERLAKKDMPIELVGEYSALYDDVYALISCRSLKHFVQYMEFDKSPEQKLWQPTMHLLGGFWYYANSMVLNNDIQFISKQCFPGLGKTYSNAYMLAFIFGNDINAYALYVFGASANVASFTSSLVDLMITERYAKVFPYFKQFHDEDSEQTKNNTFITRQIKDTGSKLRIKGSSKPYNINVVSKDKNTNGLRCQFLFLDDIAQMQDAENLTAHTKDKARYIGEWRERRDAGQKFFVIAGGTTYSIDDILTFFLNENNGDIAQKCKFNKFTSVVKSDFITSGGTSVLVKIPKLDYETDESTFPAKYKTEDIKRDRDTATDEGRLFYAMQQQMPFSSTENPFAWGNIKIYESLPPTYEQGGTRNPRCRFILDPSRTGVDKTCCLFFSQDGDKHYLVDAFVDNQPLDHKYASGDTVLDEICKKIIAKKCFEGKCEINTESTLASQIKEKLKQMGYAGCKVEGYYSWKIKKDKINVAKTSIREHIYFPSRRVFSANSEVGKAMTDITYWKYKSNVADDAPECCANYCDEYIKDESGGYATVGSFRR